MSDNDVKKQACKITYEYIGYDTCRIDTKELKRPWIRILLKGTGAWMNRLYKAKN